MHEQSYALLLSPTIRQFGRFLVVGVVNTAFGYAVFAAGILLKFSPEVSLLAATLAGVAFNFMTLGRMVFAINNIRLLPRFLANYAVIYGVNVIGLRWFASIEISSLHAQLLLLPFIAAGSFILMRRFVFQKEIR